MTDRLTVEDYKLEEQTFADTHKGRGLWNLIECGYVIAIVPSVAIGEIIIAALINNQKPAGCGNSQC